MWTPAIHHRPDVLQVVQKCHDDFTTERNRVKKAWLSQDLLALLMYTALTPGRCKEYTTLKFEVHGDSLPPLVATPGAPNCVHITSCGDAAHMVLADHKTVNHHGCDRVLLSGDSPLLRHLAQHLQHHQHLLASTQDHQWLFVVSGQVHRSVGPFTWPRETGLTLSHAHLNWFQNILKPV